MSGQLIGFDVESPGDGVAIASMDLDISDNVNEARLDFEAYNHSPSENATAVTLNALYNADVRLIANVKGDGTALKIRKFSFSKFFGSYGAGVYKATANGPFEYTKGVAIRLADSFNNGNVFVAVDMENVDVCVVHSSQANQGNTFIGGTFSWRSFGVQSTAGNRLLIQNPGVNPTSGPVTNLLDPSKKFQVKVTPAI